MVVDDEVSFARRDGIVVILDMSTKVLMYGSLLDLVISN